MPDWTVEELRRATRCQPAGRAIQWRFARDALHSPEFGVSRFTYEPGARTLGPPTSGAGGGPCCRGRVGSCQARWRGVELSAWDVLRVAPEVVRSLEAGSEGLDVICIGGRQPKGDTPSGSRTSGTDGL